MEEQTSDLLNQHHYEDEEEDNYDYDNDSNAYTDDSDADTDVPDTTLGRHELTGHYHVWVPEVASRAAVDCQMRGGFDAPERPYGWDGEDEPFTLQLSPSSTSSHLWGYFDFGVLYGWLRSTSPLPTSTAPGHNTLSFTWRGRQEAINMMEFVDDLNHGVFRFLPDGKFEGWINGDRLGMSEWYGRCVWRPNVGQIGNPEGWKREYRRLNSKAYWIENNRHWGVWDGEVMEGERNASDTDSDVDEDSDGSADYTSNKDGSQLRSLYVILVCTMFRIKVASQ
ncbi:hypothetical protein HK104_004312 [Borealophlyctis nickersoniae]|nr:hypothetical protein HK104_004312 [Borealophlyctis nickersoniae]